MIDNPFAEEVSPERRLQAEAPPSKHAAGRKPKMSASEKRRRAKLQRERIRNGADTAALLKALR